MNPFYLISFTALLVVGMAMTSAGQDAPRPGAQVAVSTNSDCWQHRYLLYLPKNYDSAKRHPLLLFLHGAGERDDNDLELVKVHGPPMLIAKNQDFPFLVVSPQCEADGWWDAAKLSDLLDHVEASYGVDSERIYVTGLSMGGFGTWDLAQYQPDRFAAIAPICGGGNVIRTRFCKPIRAAIWAFHGAQDSVVPVDQSTSIVDAVQANGTTVKLTVYPGVEHNSWTATYENSELYAWLLKHRKGVAANQ